MKRTTAICLLYLPVMSAEVFCTRTATAATTGGDASPPVRLEEIVVTAAKTSQSIQDVPLAVTAVTGERLEELGATDFSDYYRLVPGLQAVDRGDGQKKYILRGLNSESAPNLAPIVQQYLDEFPLTLVSGAQSDLRLYDLERVEVLRGPQGTLYGSGSMGGTIKYVTAKPNLRQTRGELEATGSDTEHGSGNARGHAIVDLPIIQGELGTRVVAYDEYDGGFIDNVMTGRNGTNSTHVGGGRIAVRWDPLEPLDLNLMVVGQRLRSGDLPIDTANFVAPASPFPPFVPWFPAGARSARGKSSNPQTSPSMTTHSQLTSSEPTTSRGRN